MNLPIRIGAATLSVLALATGTAAAGPVPLIGPGSRGADVAIVQSLLTANGKPVAATALSGPFTERLIQEFQAQRGLAADGVVGPETWHALEQVIAYGDSGPAVTALQRALNEKHGYHLPVTGYFGTQTDAVVRAFQAHMGISVDGIAGPQTWDELIGHFVEMTGNGPGWYQCPDAVGGTWGTGNTVATLELVAQEWADRGHRARLGVNDMSLEHGGWFPPHSGHQRGVDADLRLMRKDGLEAPLQTWRDPAYSHQLMQELVDLLYATGEVESVLFNDPAIRGARPWPGHDDHLHVHFRR